MDRDGVYFDLSWPIVRSIWWAIVWRFLAGYCLAILPVLIVGSLLFQGLGFHPSSAQALLGVLKLAVAGVVSMWAVRRGLEADFHGLCITVTESRLLKRLRLGRW